MKIGILNESKQSLGGGWSFISTFSKAAKKGGHEIYETDSCLNADVVLIPSASMVNLDSVRVLKQQGKPIILRVDNMPRNSRNRNTGSSRLRAIAEISDLIVYQSKWAQEYLSDFIGTRGMVIYNGVDTEIFHPEGEKYKFTGDPVFLYSRYNRDETKHWEVAWYRFVREYKKNKQSGLVIVGQFSPELIEYGFDFFNGEKYTYLGVQPDPVELAKIYRSCNYLLATYFNDAYSNTYQEALACGCELLYVDMSGGTPELLENGVIPKEKMFAAYLQQFYELIS